MLRNLKSIIVYFSGLKAKDERKAASISGLPFLSAELSLNNTEHDGQEIISGELRCGGCRSSFPIRSGVPRFADPERDEAQARHS